MPSIERRPSRAGGLKELVLRSSRDWRVYCSRATNSANLAMARIRRQQLASFHRHIRPHTDQAVAVPGITNAVEIYAAGQTACVVLSTLRITCWETTTEGASPAPFA